MAPLTAPALTQAEHIASPTTVLITSSGAAPTSARPLSLLGLLGHHDRGQAETASSSFSDTLVAYDTSSTAGWAALLHVPPPRSAPPRLGDDDDDDTLSRLPQGAALTETVAAFLELPPWTKRQQAAHAPIASTLGDAAPPTAAFVALASTAELQHRHVECLQTAVRYNAVVMASAAHAHIRYRVTAVVPQLTRVEALEAAQTRLRSFLCLGVVQHVPQQDMLQLHRQLLPALDRLAAAHPPFAARCGSLEVAHTRIVSELAVACMAKVQLTMSAIAAHLHVASTTADLRALVSVKGRVPLEPFVLAPPPRGCSRSLFATGPQRASPVSARLAAHSALPVTLANGVAIDAFHLPHPMACVLGCIEGLQPVAAASGGKSKSTSKRKGSVWAGFRAWTPRTNTQPSPQQHLEALHQLSLVLGELRHLVATATVTALMGSSGAAIVSERAHGRAPSDVLSALAQRDAAAAHMLDHEVAKVGSVSAHILCSLPSPYLKPSPLLHFFRLYECCKPYSGARPATVAATTYSAMPPHMVPRRQCPRPLP